MTKLIVCDVCGHQERWPAQLNYGQKPTDWVAFETGDYVRVVQHACSTACLLKARSTVSGRRSGPDRPPT